MKRFMKQLIACIAMLIFILILFINPFPSLSHSGRTDGSGGHKDKNNVSGLGPYHYHCNGNPPHLHDNGICPYKRTINTKRNSNSGTVSKKTRIPATPKPTDEVISHDFANTPEPKDRSKPIITGIVIMIFALLYGTPIVMDIVEKRRHRKKK